MSLTAAEHERLIKLMEECAEVIQICSKVMLHGYDETQPGLGKTNRERLEDELGDLMYWKQQIEGLGDINPINVINHRVNKRTTALKYTRYQKGSIMGV